MGTINDPNIFDRWMITTPMTDDYHQITISGIINENLIIRGNIHTNLDPGTNVNEKQSMHPR